MVSVIGAILFTHRRAQRDVAAQMDIDNHLAEVKRKAQKYDRSSVFRDTFVFKKCALNIFIMFVRK